MPVFVGNEVRRRLLRWGGATLSWATIASGSAFALDMDTGATVPPPAQAAHQSGELDMDVNPSAPIRSAPAVVPHDNVQDGIAPLSPKAAVDPAPVPQPDPLGPGAVPAPAPIPAAVAPPPVILDHPKVVDTAKLQAGDTSVTLYGIAGISGEAAQGLQGFLASGDNHLTCQEQGGTGFVCLMSDGTDVAQVALVNGAARTLPDAPDAYREQEAAAQAARRGVWVNLPPPPETVKHPVVQDTATLVAEGKTYVLDGVVGFPMPYSGQLQGYIAGNGDAMTCSPQAYPGHFVCVLPDGTDIAKVALVNGAAQVGQDAPDAYRVQQLDALNNRRGVWQTASQDMIAAATYVPQPDEYVLVAGDDGTDGITYVGGAPVALIDGEQTFLVYGDGLGWGYYDHYHHWRGAPDRYRNHLEHFHPGGHGLRGFDHGFHAGHEMGRPGMAGHEVGRPGMAGHEMGRPGMPGHDVGRPGMPGHDMAGRPGMGAAPGHEVGGFHPGVAGHPGPQMAAAGHPGFAGASGGGFMHPGAGASAGGFHPGGAAGGFHPAAAAPHPSGGGGGGKHK